MNYSQDMIKKQYLTTLQGRLDFFLQNHKQLLKGDFSQEDAVRRLALLLNGSGATYGFPKISEYAAQVVEANREKLADRLQTLIKYLDQLIKSETSTANRVLIIEDDQISKVMLKEQISGLFHTIDTADSVNQALELIRNFKYDMILLDLMLPDQDGRNILIELRNNSITATLPVLVLSSLTDPIHVNECYMLGADGFIPKPVNREILLSTIRSRLGQLSQNTTDENIDELTQLPDRLGMLSYYENYIKTETGTTTWAVLFDFDDFKTFNKKYGYQAGNAVLEKFAVSLNTYFEDAIIISRWSGDAFLLFLGENLEKAVISELLHEFRESNRPGGDEADIYDDNDLSYTVAAQRINLDGTLPKILSLLELQIYNDRHGDRLKTVVTDIRKDKNKNILLIQDDELMAAIIRHRLGKDGFFISWVRNRDQAFEKLARIQTDAIVMDARLPGYDGYQVLRDLKDHPAYKMIPVIFLSSMGQDKDFTRAFKLGADDYIVKPFSPAEITVRINRLLKNN